MKVSIAKTSGFCMGVRRAVDMVLHAANKYARPVYTYGPLIHNPQFLSLLADKQISVLEKIPGPGRGTVLIRAHGVPPAAYDELTAAGFHVIDATCPKVKRVQTIIEKNAGRGAAVIILGNKHHAEVVGLLGYSGEQGYTVESLAELKELPAFDKAIVVSQTTQDLSLFEEIKEWLKIHRPHYKIINTICPATQNRQAEARELAGTVDAMIVVGGYNSGNTRRLVQVAEKSGCPTYHVETADDLDVDGLINVRHIGITAGASTPNWITKEIYRKIEAAHYTSKGKTVGRLFFLLHLLLFTNIYLALGAGSLCYSAALLRYSTCSLPHGLIAMLYILSMHTLNRLTDIDEDHYNDPYRAGFYKRNLGKLAFLAGGIVLTALLLAWPLGPLSFCLLLFMSLLGVVYNLNLVPSRYTDIKIRRIKDIPGSKTILVPLAWGVILCLLPTLDNGLTGLLDLPALLAALFVAAIIFARSAFFDVIEMQGNKITGRETLPILIGGERMLLFLKFFLGAVFLLLLGASLLGLVSAFGYVLLFLPVTSFLLYSAYEQGTLHSGLIMEFLVDGQFLLAGILALAWAAV